jgi:hypothetical protein
VTPAFDYEFSTVGQLTGVDHTGVGSCVNAGIGRTIAVTSGKSHNRSAHE